MGDEDPLDNLVAGPAAAAAAGAKGAHQLVVGGRNAAAVYNDVHGNDLQPAGEAPEADNLNSVEELLDYRPPASRAACKLLPKDESPDSACWRLVYNLSDPQQQKQLETKCATMHAALANWARLEQQRQHTTRWIPFLDTLAEQLFGVTDYTHDDYLATRWMVRRFFCNFGRMSQLVLREAKSTREFDTDISDVMQKNQAVISLIGHVAHWVETSCAVHQGVCLTQTSTLSLKNLVERTMLADYVMSRSGNDIPAHERGYFVRQLMLLEICSENLQRHGNNMMCPRWRGNQFLYAMEVRGTIEKFISELVNSQTRPYARMGFNTSLNQAALVKELQIMESEVFREVNVSQGVYSCRDCVMDLANGFMHFFLPLVQPAKFAELMAAYDGAMSSMENHLHTLESRVPRHENAINATAKQRKLLENMFIRGTSELEDTVAEFYLDGHFPYDNMIRMLNACAKPAEGPWITGYAQHESGPPPIRTSDAHGVLPVCYQQTAELVQDAAGEERAEVGYAMVLPWWLLPTPEVNRILNTQAFDWETQRVGFWVMFGRAIWQRDDWQVAPWVYGLAGTGKSVIAKFYSSIHCSRHVTRDTQGSPAFDGNSMLQSNMEKGFGLGDVLQNRPFLIICADATPDLMRNLSEDYILQMIANEVIRCARKNKSTALYFAPMLVFFSNYPQPWRGRAGNMTRRFVQIQFTKPVTNEDAGLFKRSQEPSKRITFLIKSYLAYSDFLVYAQHKRFWDAAPEYLLRCKRQAEKTNDPLSAFILGSIGSTLFLDWVDSPGGAASAMLWNDFKKLMKKYCSNENVQLPGDVFEDAAVPYVLSQFGMYIMDATALAAAEDASTHLTRLLDHYSGQSETASMSKWVVGVRRWADDDPVVKIRSHVSNGVLIHRQYRTNFLFEPLMSESSATGRVMKPREQVLRTATYTMPLEALVRDSHVADHPHFTPEAATCDSLGRLPIPVLSLRQQLEMYNITLATWPEIEAKCTDSLKSKALAAGARDMLPGSLFVIGLCSADVVAAELMAGLNLDDMAGDADVAMNGLGEAGSLMSNGTG